MRSAERARHTLGELIAAGARRFRAAHLAFGHGTLRARDEAAWLALHAIGLPPGELAPHLSRALAPAEVRAIEKLYARRIAERRPAAYLTREAWLGDFRFYVDERAIVPRSFIAGLLQEGLAPWVTKPGAVRTALDLCTGSGCLAVLLAHAFPRAAVDAADLSAAALAVARKNVQAYDLENRIRLVRSNLFANLAGGRYDVIVSNPPYVRESVMRRLPEEYRREPRLALAGGADGLDLVRDIVAQAPRHLAKKGLLVVEVGHNRSRVEAAFPRLPFTWAETDGGDDCVFLLTRAELEAAAAAAPIS